MYRGGVSKIVRRHDFAVATCSQHSVDVRQVVLEPSINHASAHRYDSAMNWPRILRVRLHEMVCVGARALRLPP